MNIYRIGIGADKPGQVGMKRHQRGATLLVALVMLMLLSLLAVSAMNSTTMNLQVAGNAQFREEALGAAQQAIETVISTDFTVAPVASNYAVDVNQDGKDDYNVNVAVPACRSSISDTQDICTGSVAIRQGVVLDASGNPLQPQTATCRMQTWEVAATVDDPFSGANLTVRQGIYQIVPGQRVCTP